MKRQPLDLHSATIKARQILNAKGIPAINLCVSFEPLPCNGETHRIEWQEVINNVHHCKTRFVRWTVPVQPSNDLSDWTEEEIRIGQSTPPVFGVIQP